MNASIRTAVRATAALAMLVPALLAAPQIVQQEAYLKASNTGAGDVFGSDVAMSGDTLVVGAPDEDSNAIGVDGDGANDGAENSGAAYVLVNSGASWSQQAYLKPSFSRPWIRFGYSVASSGDTIVVGAPDECSGATGINGDASDCSIGGAGAAYVFVRTGGTWNLQAYLKSADIADWGSAFGFDVAISGDTIVVGAPGESSMSTGVNGDPINSHASGAGAAYVFVRSGTTWTQQAYLKASNTGSNDWFGHSVAIFGDTIVVGAVGEDSSAVGVGGDQSDNGASSAGAAYVFERSGSTWAQQAYLKASNTDTNDWFGGAAAISADTIVVGAYADNSGSDGVNGDRSDDPLFRVGAAYVFVRSGTNWSQEAYLKASNSGGGDEFGRAVAIANDLIVIGAWSESSDSTGVNGDQSVDDPVKKYGAAYVFWRDGVAWSQQAYLKSSNLELGDQFGGAVAVSGNAIVVGASFEDSSAAGVGGEQSDNHFPSAGAAYAFTFDPPAYSYFCSGDGSLATPCPCTPPNTVPSPPAAEGHGCANSLSAEGALLSASGSLSPDELEISVHVAPAYAAFALLVKGDASDANGVASSDGLRCVDGAIVRFGGHIAGANGDAPGRWSYPNAVQTTPISTMTSQAPGQTAYYQLYYRNAAASFCTPATTNWSSGLVVPWP